MKIAVAIATTGRPDIVGQMLLRLKRQTRAPDQVLVVGAADKDLPNRQSFGGVDFVLNSKGSSKQRNRALDLIGTAFDIVIFFDDDFVPARDFIAGVERLMREHPEVVAASGHLLADGFRSAGLSFAEADELISRHEQGQPGEPIITDQVGAYGCNMIFRLAALPQARFDEALPLYGWLEDLDFSAGFAKVGRIVETGLCAGVHLGAKSGRSAGLQLGYSQIANPLYLAGKGTMPRKRAIIMACKNIIANSLKSVSPEPYIDRRGRLRGNLVAIGDLIRRRIHPMRVMDLQPPAQAPRAQRALP